MFAAGFRHSATSVYALVIFATYVGVGALAHDLGFSAVWLTCSTLFVWAAPAQVILISGLGTGGSLVETAIAVTLTAVRLLPMTVALLPLVKTPQTKLRELIFTSHFVAISVWIESLRLLPSLPVVQRMSFSNGISLGLLTTAVIGGLIGFYLTAGLPTVFAAALLFITPIAFFISAVRNSRDLLDKLSFWLGLIIGPLLSWYAIGLDLMWAGLLGGGIAYGVRRLRARTS